MSLAATPTTVTPPLTPTLRVTCLAPPPRPGDALQYLDGITMTLDGLDLATVSLHFPPTLLTSQPGWAVDGGLEGQIRRIKDC